MSNPGEIPIFYSFLELPFIRGSEQFQDYVVTPFSMAPGIGIYTLAIIYLPPPIRLPKSGTDINFPEFLRIVKSKEISHPSYIENPPINTLQAKLADHMTQAYFSRTPLLDLGIIHQRPAYITEMSNYSEDASNTIPALFVAGNYIALEVPKLYES